MKKLKKLADYTTEELFNTSTEERWKLMAECMFSVYEKKGDKNESI